MNNKIFLDPSDLQSFLSGRSLTPKQPPGPAFPQPQPPPQPPPLRNRGGPLVGLPNPNPPPPEPSELERTFRDVLRIAIGAGSVRDLPAELKHVRQEFDSLNENDKRRVVELLDAFPDKPAWDASAGTPPLQLAPGVALDRSATRPVLPVPENVLPMQGMRPARLLLPGKWVGELQGGQGSVGVSLGRLF